MQPSMVMSHLRVIAQILVDCSAGILHCHFKRIIHRDIAARNFVVDSFYRGMVCDFGLSRRLQEGEDNGINGPQDLLPIRWCAPETIRDGTYSERSDVYMFGVFMWEIMSRTEPFRDVTPVDFVQEMCESEHLRPVLSDSVCYPPEWENLMNACFEHSPDQRPTMQVVNERLQAFFMKCMHVGDDLSRLPELIPAIRERVAVRSGSGFGVMSSGNAMTAMSTLSPPPIPPTVGSPVTSGFGGAVTALRQRAGFNLGREERHYERWITVHPIAAGAKSLGIAHNDTKRKPMFGRGDEYILLDN